MIIYPAIDIKDGKCVRLQQGSFDAVTVYSDNPAEMARKWEECGASWLHTVDLDGARGGNPINLPVVGEIAKSVKMPVQMGGGIRNLKVIESAIENGISRVILGTSAVNDPQFVKEALRKFEKSIVIGIDAKDEKVAIEGWEKLSSFTAAEFAKRMEDLGAGTIIYTDISTDGMLKGPNLKAMEQMLKAVSMDVIASGGVSKLQDIKDLKEVGVAGVIVGKALYTGNLDLREAIEAAK
ncbi:MAG: 1-(5-phosphoribosyl)-5-((5-phosphoribosylamino)methylideneamino) imidazole-4-carboxamide isomerase [Clostridiales bacterium]|nr:1-(5-phosphoribosyl)-5-((5-phosphoribosylamino)methylideneamino) imidazole-4-carboxamide isomerase [Clostridiales bacterium]